MKGLFAFVVACFLTVGLAGNADAQCAKCQPVRTAVRATVAAPLVVLDRVRPVRRVAAVVDRVRPVRRTAAIVKRAVSVPARVVRRVRCAGC